RRRRGRVELSAVHQRREEDHSALLDAKDMTELARADFQTEASNPADFHGWYLNEDEIQSN
ncbi:hypothetical protein GE061_011502, partial [Apolygus lucorum]